MDKGFGEIKMEAPEIVEKIRSKFTDAIVEADIEAVDPFAIIKPEGVHECIRYLHDETGLKFDYLMSITGVDFQGIREEAELGVVYHLYSYKHRHTFVIKTLVNREDPHVPTIMDLYDAANFQEREAFDLFGIIFDGHSDLRRILLPPQWEGHPMRKDWEEPETILGISTTRKTLRERLAEKNNA